jgi:F420H(2)-dependent quinone reductase
MQAMSDATTRWARGAGAEFFRTLNALVEPAVRAGCASPELLPTGMLLLETTGAKSGRPRRVPLLATVLEGCLFVGTARGDRSQWLHASTSGPRRRRGPAAGCDGLWLAVRGHQPRTRRG